MTDANLTIAREDLGLLTDLYQLTMAACYAGEGLDARRASFELFARRLPPGYGYAIAAGLEQALAYLEGFRLTPQQVAALQNSGIFDAAVPDETERFWSLLETPFSGDLWAVPEGTAIFANEPILRVEAPLWQAQLVETYLLNAVNYQTLIATRSARTRDAAGDGVLLLEFGTRRAFGPQASLWAARAALAAGFDATSNVLAAFALGRQPAGTMAHSLVMAVAAERGTEMQAFETFHRYFPGAPLLIDTYDTIAAAKALADRLERGEMELRGVRIDSGDLVALSREVRSILPDVPIFLSGDLDEFEIVRLLEEGAFADAYGIGTKLVTGTPFNGVYKLTDLEGKPVMKRSHNKETYPGRKQIFRRWDGERLLGDRLGLVTETPQPGEEAVLQLVLKNGERSPQSEPQSEPLEAIARRTRAQVKGLSGAVRDLRDPAAFPVEISQPLQALADRTRDRL